ncbi:hypothetical protein [Pseudoclavibacter sp. RFBB5]|uniref:hypothetical protein n=1 Tax=Pseudoclavibacter sp. RFBB5 TaxID=2080574 RepID=UPI000CE80DCE|nr:hypothetical protein [Pseudoclavibacter sp. RFBB5]PPG31740.1 hypothetical protein C5B97_04735 [Pseudoclavibacter sp. RFBB5]
MTEYTELVEALKRMQGTDSEYIAGARTTASLSEQILQDAVGTDSTQTARRFLIDPGTTCRSCRTQRRASPCDSGVSTRRPSTR